MSTRDHSIRTIRVCRGLCAVILSLWLTGCAASAGNTLLSAQAEQVRRLAADCYAHHDGERYLYGGFRVHAACRSWARDVVGVTFANR